MMNPDFLIIDLFCGAGGTTSGFEQARLGRKKVAKVIACVNHDPFAIASHSSNHKSVLHFTEDIRTLELGPLIRHVERMQRRYPNAKLVLWASLECTNFSKAKGGQPRDADSRTLAEHLFRYFTLQLDYIMIENVEEFMCWGPLDENGKPISKREGEDFVKWRESIKALGYNYDHRLLNSADYGAYTSRLRYFAMFAKPGCPIVWPEPTHAKKPLTGSLFSHALRKWKPVKDVLDLEDEGRDIFERSKPLSEKTLQRIYAGLIKFVAGGKDAFETKKVSSVEITDGENFRTVSPAFIVQRNGGDPNSKLVDINSPARTVTSTGGNQDIVQSTFLVNYHHSSVVDDINKPCPTLTTRDKFALLKPAFLVKYLSNSPKTGYSVGANINDPAPVITAQARLAACFIASYHGNGHNCTSSESPAPTVAAADTLAKVQAEWIDNQYGNSKATSMEQPIGSILNNPKQNVVKAQFIDMQHSQGKQNESIETPVGAITTVPKKNLVTAKFLINHNFSNGPRSIDDPAPTLLASRKHYYLINPSWGGNPGSVEQPCPVIVARQDKAPLYITFTEGGEAAIEVYETDSPTTILIKQFMALYGIARITMRMLKVIELKLIMGLPIDYVLCGNQGKQKWMIGNMVHPLVPKAMARRLAQELFQQRKSKAA